MSSKSNNYVGEQVTLKYVHNISYYYLLPAFAHHSLYHKKDIILNSYLLNTLISEYNYTHFLLCVKDSDEGLEFIDKLWESYFIETIHTPNAPTSSYLVGIELPSEYKDIIVTMLKSNYSKLPNSLKNDVVKNTLDPQAKLLKKRVFSPSFQDRKDFADFFNVPIDLIQEIGPKVDEDKETFKPNW